MVSHKRREPQPARLNLSGVQDISKSRRNKHFGHWSPVASVPQQATLGSKLQVRDETNLTVPPSHLKQAQRWVQGKIRRDEANRL